VSGPFDKKDSKNYLRDEIVKQLMNYESKTEKEAVNIYEDKKDVYQNDTETNFPDMD
jgi:hypothetical protein